jgi:hypothetical protein
MSPLIAQHPLPDDKFVGSMNSMPDLVVSKELWTVLHNSKTMSVPLK